MLKFLTKFFLKDLSKVVDFFDHLDSHIDALIAKAKAEIDDEYHLISEIWETSADKVAELESQIKDVFHDREADIADTEDRIAALNNKIATATGLKSKASPATGTDA